MAILCPDCKSELDATLLQFNNFVLCRCGSVIFLDRHSKAIKAINVRTSILNYQHIVGQREDGIIYAKTNM